MIDKITPRALDKSSDYKLVPKTSMVDALNLFITDDNVDAEGNVGVLKNIKGNKNIVYATSADEPTLSEEGGYEGGALKVVGSVTDSKTQICYFFVRSQNPANHGIWAYDKHGKLPISKTIPAGTPNSIRKIFTSTQFNFPEHGFVKGDIVYTNTNEFEKHPSIKNHLESNKNLKVDFEKDVLLYFTDNKNEPRKINVYRALLEKGSRLAGTDYIDDNYLELTDFICACPKTPLERITFEFSPDATRSVNNFATSPGFQFAYQNIYKDGVESAISTYSATAFPPSVLNRGAAQSSNILAHNLCTLTIPAVGPEIESIRILARYGNAANFFEIDEVSNTVSETANWDTTNRTYKFYNDRVASGVSPLEVDKTFDNLPRKAQAQTAISNRLVYGNYLEGYDNVSTNCSSKVIYNQRPQDFLDLVLRVHPSIEPTRFGDNKCVGFQIDTTEMPSRISAGTTINVVVEYSPDKSFHIYQAHDINHSYHQSRQMGKYSSNAAGYRHWPLKSDNNLYYEGSNGGGAGEGIGNTGMNNTHAGTPADLQEGYEYNNEDAWPNANDSGQDFLRGGSTNDGVSQRFFGTNYGVGSEGGTTFNYGANQIGTSANLPLWHVTNNPSANLQNVGGSEHNARYGTSAGNPLIIKPAALEFSVKFEVIENILYDGKALISETVTEALAGADGTVGNVFTWADKIEIDVINDVKNTFKVEKDEYDLQLDYTQNGGYTGVGSSSFAFSPIEEDHSYLICGVGDGGVQVSNNTISENGNNLLKEDKQKAIPLGYFIINRAEVDFYLERVFQPFHPSKNHLRLCISKIDADEPGDIMTCFKRMDPTSPWWAIHPETIQDVNFYKFFNIPQTDNPSTDDYNEDNTLDTIWDTTDTASWQASIPYKFNLLNPVLDDGNPTATVPVKWFTAKFDQTDADFAESGPGLTGQTYEDEHFPNAGFCGWLDTSNGLKLYKPHNADGDYIPRLGVEKFKFSLMDGEGGPGGANAGGNSGQAAYDKYGNSTYGSIAARVDFGYDGSSVVVRKDIYGVYEALVGGSFANEDGSEDTSLGTTPKGTRNAEIAGDSEYNLTEDPDNPGLWRETYVVSGPFFTGSIAMNPIVGADLSDVANPQPFPPVKDFTTTLPLIWLDNEGRYLNTLEPIPRNWLKTCYPWPQVIKPTQTFSWFDNQGVLANAEIDSTPFWNPQYYGDNNTGEGELIPYPVDNLVDDYTSPPPQQHFGSVDFSLTHSHIEGKGRTSFIAGDTAENLSFKSSATHEFGIVYYDQRGRHGYVNHLDSVYVEGYSPQSRGGSNLQGTAHIQLELLHAPPAWAHNYKIVYSKNTSVSDFIQYSAGGAFTAAGETPGSDPSNIYVSLNYLQGHPISYSSAWGAKSQDGSMVLYTPQDGDRLRVISYMLPPSGLPVPERVYPLNYEFEVSGVVSLDDSESNPLAVLEEDNVIIDANKQGLFLVLKNNEGASGFRYQDVRDGVHNWKNNCLMEIYSPVKELNAEDRLYYEIGDTYKVLRTSGGMYIHETPEMDGVITLTEGDVYFRSAAVNFRDYDENIVDGGLVGYEDIIIETIYDEGLDDGINQFKTSESNFKSYYIESPAGTDLFKSDSISIGRPNMIKHDAQEAFKEASVIHSDRDITEAGKVSYSSFNRSIPIDKDLDLKNGAINYLANHDENCIFIQKNKCGHIPIDRSIISDVSGESNLIASSKFLNTPRYYAGRAGADGNPESVVSINNAVYFANKSLGEVYRVSSANGVNVISENNMKSYFRNLFRDAIEKSTVNGDDVRVVGGYDPVKNEYLITVLDPTTWPLSGTPDFPDQPEPAEEVEKLGCTNPSSSNYDPTATIDDGSCVNICDFDDLYDIDGNVTQESINAAFYEALDLPPEEAVERFPDMNGDGTIGNTDLNSVLQLGPPYCGDEALLPQVTASWGVGGSLNPYGGAFWLPENFPVENWLYEQTGEKVGLPDIQPMKFYLNRYNFENLEPGQEIKVTVEIVHGQDSVEYTDQNNVGVPYSGGLDTMFYLKNSSDEETSGVIVEDIPGRKYTYVVSGDDITGAASQENTTLDVFFPMTKPPELSWLNGMELSTGFFYDMGLHPKPEWGANSGLSNEDVERVNSIKVSVEYTNIDRDDWFVAAELKGNLAWNDDNEDLGSPPPKFLPPTLPLPFTGNLCDYPWLSDDNNQITLQSITDAKNYVQGQIASGAMSAIEATHHFPNWPSHTMFPTPNPGYVNAGDMIAYFNENDGVNFQDMNEFFEQFPEFNQYNTGVNSDFEPTHAYHQWITGENPNWPWNDNTAVSAGQIALQCAQPYTGNLCDYPFLFNTYNNTINVILNGYAWEPMNAEAVGISQTGIAYAYEHIMMLLSFNQITQAEATVMVPDLTGDGMIGSGDLIMALNLTTDNIMCTDTLDWTGDICDYPWLLNDDGVLDEFNAQFWFIIAKHWTAQYDNWLAPGYGTLLFPDFNSDGIISMADWLEMLQLLVNPPACPEFGKPGKGTPGPKKLSLQSRKLFAKGMQTVADRHKKELEKRKHEKK